MLKNEFEEAQKELKGALKHLKKIKPWILVWISRGLTRELAGNITKWSYNVNEENKRYNTKFENEINNFITEIEIIKDKKLKQKEE